MKRILALSGLGLLAYLVFLIAMLPASQVWRFAAEPIQRQAPQLAVYGLSGTLWRGQASELRWQGHSLGRLEWQLSPWSLLRQRLDSRFSLQTPQGYLQGRLQLPLSATSLELAEVQGRLPLQELSRFANNLPLQLDGQLSIQLKQLRRDKQGAIQALQGQLIWHQASVLMGEPLSLGDLRAELSDNGEGALRAQLHDHGGPLRLDGEFHLSAQGRYRLQANLGSRESAQPALQQGLAMLGRPDAQGNYPLQFNGSLPGNTR
ncbi:MAG: type II secretion system protein N [Chromatiales bacterium]|nr:type II secretion system protein N [Gammaproteobacteria bacterium]MBW6475662.1 type II secretion system protein N [Chromatiales bacterium]